MNHSFIGGIPSREALRAGQAFILQDGSTLWVQLVENQLQVFREGQRLLRNPYPAPPQQQWYAQHPQFRQSQQFLPYAQQQPQWGQQLTPSSGQPFYGQPPYGVSPSPDCGQSQQPKKRLQSWLLAILGGIVALSCVGSFIFIAQKLGSSNLGSDPLSLLIVLFFFIEVPILTRLVDDYILEHGDLVGGRIIKHHQQKNEDGFPFYYLTYTYEYRGEPYSKKQRVNEKTYREIPDGTRISVRCLPKHPKRARIDERWSRNILLDPGIWLSLSD